MSFHAIPTCIAISATSFLTGVAFTSLLWDATLLYNTKGPVTTALVEAVEEYYMTWWNGAVAVKTVIHVAYFVGLLMMATKWARKNESAYFFSGASMLFYIVIASLYLTITLPYLRVLAHDTLIPRPGSADPDILTRIQEFVISWNPSPISDLARENLDMDMNAEPMDMAQRIMHLSVMGAANTVGIICLIGVIVMQISEWWVEENIAKQQRDLVEKTSKSE